MPERGLPLGIKMRHDSHYVEELAKANRSVGKVIAVDKIEPNPDQPRNEIGDLTELSASIKAQGVLEPLLVKPHDNGTYMIIAGERRWRASKLAGLEEVPCIELDIDENTIAEIALIENMQRKDLTIWEVADGFKDLVDRFGYTHDDIADKIGKSRSTVTESIAIASLPEKVRARCVEADINAKSVLIEVSRQFDETAMHSLLDDIQNKDLKRTEIREKVRQEPVSKAKAPTPTKADTDSPDEESGNAAPPPVEENFNSFEYFGMDENFTVRIDFSVDTEFSKKDILIALKEVFDAVKSGAIDD